MGLNIVSWPNEIDPNNPLENVYGYNAGFHVDASQGIASVTLNIHPNEAAWQGRPAGQIQIYTGQILVPAVVSEIPEESRPEVRVKTLAEFMEDPEFAAAYAVIGNKLYQEWLKHPLLQGATIQ